MGNFNNIIKQNILSEQELLYIRNLYSSFNLNRLENNLLATKDILLRQESKNAIRECLFNDNYSSLKWKNRYIELFNLDRYSRIRKHLINSIDEFYIDELAEFVNYHLEEILYLVNKYNLADEVVKYIIDSRFELIIARI